MRQRITTGVVAGALFLGILVWGGYAFAALLAAMAIIGYDEYIRMNGIRRTNAAAWIGLAAMLSVFALSVGSLGDSAWAEWLTAERLVWLLLFVLFAVTVASKNRTTIDQIALLFIGAFYIGFGFRFMLETRGGADGLFWTFFVFLCIWMSDAGAYFSGKWLGSHKLWPEISPNKTVEGAVGGLILAVLVALCFHFARPELLAAGRAAALGVLIAVVGTVGDLIQSAYKRVKGIKDTGTLLPGHGGVLDRTDSWLIVFPFLQLLALLPQ